LRLIAGVGSGVEEKERLNRLAVRRREKVQACSVLAPWWRDCEMITNVGE
jgi:hypothetical protein